MEKADLSELPVHQISTEGASSVVFDLFLSAFPFLISALIGALALYYVNYNLLPFIRKKEKAGMILGELANAIRHFKRSVQSLRSSYDKTRLGRTVDYQKCKYAETGFVGLEYSDLMGLPGKIGRDVMQMGMIYRNTNLEVDYIVAKMSRTSENESERAEKFVAMERLIKRMEAIVGLSEQLFENVQAYERDVRALSANREIQWDDSFYEQGGLDVRDNPENDS